MNVLFVCKHNRFRSKVAEAFFKKYNKNSKNRVRSRGIIKDINVAENTIRVLKEKGIELKDKKSRKISEKDIKWADLIVIVADNINLNFKGKKILRWKISDVSQDNIKGIRNRIGIIEKKVLKLINKLNKSN